MKILYRLNDAGWIFWCPGCDSPHGVWTDKPNETTGAKWTFDGNEEKPTFNPSILCFSTYAEDGSKLPEGQRRTLCHSFVRAGMIEFCGDSPHKLAGQTVPLPPF